MFFIKKKENNFQDKFKKVTYSQCGEDMILYHIFESLGVKTPSYIDVGAHHPFHMSNTALFHSMGSTGINIEPDPVLFKEFPKYRKSDINLNIGIGNTPDLIDFYRISAPTLNTFSKEEAEKYINEGDYKIIEVIKVKVETFHSILAEFVTQKKPTFLTIDAEGVDELIIDSIDFDKFFPEVICIETISFSTSGKGIKNYDLIKKIELKGYLNYADTNINTIFVRSDIWG